jgi:hypothetical protein
MAVSFKGAHFPQDIILMGVRWYVAYPLSTRHVEELMEERGVSVDHSTINRWVVKYSPQLEEAFHRRKRPVWVSWRLPADARRDRTHAHAQEKTAGGRGRERGSHCGRAVLRAGCVIPPIDHSIYLTSTSHENLRHIPENSAKFMPRPSHVAPGG